MNIKINYRITRERAGLLQEFTGTRHFVIRAGEAVEDTAKRQLAADFQVPSNAVEIRSVEN